MSSITMNLNKSSNMSASISVDGKPIVSLSSIVSKRRSGDSITHNIINKELYYANKEKVREQIALFYNEFYEMQDAVYIEKDDAISEPETNNQTSEEV